MCLMSVNVTGDGNCFYRALSFILHGNEDHHTELRRSIADHLTRNYKCIFNVSNIVTHADNISIEQHIQCMRLDGVWAGEEAILAAADFLKRELHIFKYVTSSVISPTVYTPASGSCLGSPLRIAFLEPGHFHAVFDDTNSNKSNNDIFIENSNKKSFKCLVEVQGFTSKPICNFSAAKLLLFNSRSVINKWREICFAIDYYNADIVAVTETWLSAESDSHAFSYRNYKKILSLSQSTNRWRCYVPHKFGIYCR